MTRPVAPSLSRLASWACCGTLLVLAHAPAHAAAPAAMLRPCHGECAVGRKQELVLTLPGMESPVAFATLISKIDEIRVNAAGNVIVAGDLPNGWTAIDIIQPGRKDRPLAEFWTTSYGISSSARFVAFTAAVSPHGEDSEYADTMIYVYDAGATAKPETIGPSAPASAVAVYPRALVAHGYRYVMQIPGRRLATVATIDMKWHEDTSFTFLLNFPQTAGSDTRFVPTTISAGHTMDWHHAEVTQTGVAFRCNLLGMAENPTINAILSHCSR